MTTKIIQTIQTVIVLSVLGSIVLAQQMPTPSPTPTPKKENEIKKIEQDLEDIFRRKPRRPSVSNPADFNTPGVLQIEYGYGGYFRSDSFHSQNAGTLTVSFAATERIGFEFDLDTISAQKDNQLIITSGIGDSRLGVQFDISDETKQKPSFAISYFAKLPTANAAKNLGTGRIDHQISLLFSKKFGKFDFDFNTAMLVNGKQNEKGFLTGGKFAFGFSRDINKKLNFQSEIYGESKDSDEPQGLFAATIISYQLSKKLNFNTSVKFGLTPASPRIGLTAGISYTFGNLFKKQK